MAERHPVFRFDVLIFDSHLGQYKRGAGVPELHLFIKLSDLQDTQQVQLQVSDFIRYVKVERQHLCVIYVNTSIHTVT